MRRSIILLTAVIAAIFSVCTASYADVTLKAESLVFNGANEDLMGAGTAAPDGKPDAVFTLTVTGAQAIREISLKNDTTGVVWSTSDTKNLLLVKNSKGETLNKTGRMTITPVILAAQFTLIINDAAGAIPKDSDFTATATLIDKAETGAATSVKAVGAAKTEEPKSGESKKDEVSLFESRGLSEQDFAGEKKSVGANGRNDYRFDAHFKLSQGVQVKGIKVVAENGAQRTEWDTVPSSKAPLAVVIDESSNILNKTDGSLSFGGDVRAMVFVDDKQGLLEKPKTAAKIMVTLSDGRMLEMKATEGKKAVAADSVEVEYKGASKYDFVGQSKKFESNMNPDSFVKVSVNAKGRITGVRVANLKNNQLWDTVPGSKSYLAVVLTPEGKRLNKADGSVAIDINGTEEFHIAFDEEKDQNTGPYKTTIVFDDGRLMEGVSAKTASAAKDKNESAVSKADRSVVFVSTKPASVAVDLVGKNKKKGANGAKDMALTVKATGKGVIKAMVLADSSGAGWDTLASNNGRWLLGVREGNKFLNAANGTVKLSVNGTKSYQLLMQNNGKLNAKTGKLLLTVTWGDGEVTETELKW
ncbi:hypothetical protein [Cloacibacillus porcorum]|uniref:hypothetical protein n=1 Tax=Cloacibacillus porcorum TaxID=1197717 RepID=UPI002671AC15|nr:hypothetical protein [Cloacibacillus porcorum]